MTKRDRITQKAKQLLSLKPDGLRFAQLAAALGKAFPAEPRGNITGSIWDLHTRFPREIYKARRGVFRSTKYRSKAEKQPDFAARKESEITITHFHDTMNEIRSRFPQLKPDDVFVLWFLVAYLVEHEDEGAQGARRRRRGQGYRRDFDRRIRESRVDRASQVS